MKLNRFRQFGMILTIFIAGLLMSACSPVEFDPDTSCDGFGGQECEVDNLGLRHFDNTISVGNRPADILFINDNSGSMSDEQAKMAEKFPTFLDSLVDVDFQIAITTTDVASDENLPDAVNKNGALQDGKFIPFSEGEFILTPASTNLFEKFTETIKRPETIECEESGFKASKCPSSDERAIYAANLALARPGTGFFRQDSHLAIVILSDEDERSDSGSIPGYPLESLDTAQSLIANVKATLGADRTFSVHSLVIKPGDRNCLREQRDQNGVSGFFGSIYADLSERTMGTVGSICATDYGTELSDIGQNIVEQVNSVELACAPVNEEVEVVVDPPVDDFEFLVDSGNRRVWFNQNLPFQTTVRVVYDCEQ